MLSAGFGQKTTDNHHLIIERHAISFYPNTRKGGGGGREGGVESICIHCHTLIVEKATIKGLICTTKTPFRKDPCTTGILVKLCCS